MTKIMERTIFGIVFLCFLTGVGVIFPSLTEADLSVMVKNETGYDLEEVKYVQEMGAAKSLVGQTQNLANGNSHSFRGYRKITFTFKPLSAMLDSWRTRWKIS